jgi:hypothetical protein
MLGAEGSCKEVHGLQCVVLWDEGGEEMLLGGFLEAIPEDLSV